MKDGRTEVDGVAMYVRAWGVLKIDTQDEWLLDGYYIKGKRSQTDRNYVQVSIRNYRDRRDCKVLARRILNAPEGMEVDHINHDPTDNRRCNLRLCTRGENRRNSRPNKGHSSRFKGVTYHDARKWNPRCSAAKPWRALTRLAGKRIELGYHATDSIYIAIG